MTAPIMAQPYGPPVLVVPDKYVRGFPEARMNAEGQDDFRLAPLQRFPPLVEALTTRYATDAHFSPYCTGIALRLKKGIFDHRPDGDLLWALRKRNLTEETIAEALRTIEVTMVAFVGDVDGHGMPALDLAAWRQAEGQKIEALRREQPGVVVYYTRGGYRLVVLLPLWFLIRSDDDAAAWTRYYLGTGGYLSRRFGILVDANCKGWHRLYRLPFVLRDGEPQNWPVHGDLRAIGILDHFPDDADFAEAARLAATDGKWRIGDERLVVGHDEDDQEGGAGHATDTAPVGPGTSWDLAGQPVRDAMELIARNFPPRRRWELSLAVAGLLRTKGATETDAGRIIFEAFRRGGSDKPAERAAVVTSTWALPQGSPMTAYDRVRDILGEEVARRLGELLDQAGRDAFSARILAGRRSQSAVGAPTTQPGGRTEQLRARLPAGHPTLTLEEAERKMVDALNRRC